MIRRPPRSTLFPTRRSSDLFEFDLHDLFDLHEEPLVDLGDVVHLVQRPAGSEGIAHIPDAVRTWYVRSEEHTLNSSHDQISYAVFCLKKKECAEARSLSSRH